MQYAFYESVLRPLAVSGKYRRVLITGATDYAMLEIVHHVYHSEGIIPDFTLVDFAGLIDRIHAPEVLPVIG